MSEQYNGLPANTLDNLLPQQPIISSTNTNPIVIRTNTAHGMTTGDWVSVNEHDNVNANGVWVATVIDTIHFSIPVAGSSAGTTFGSCQPQSFGPTYQIPTDGDSLDAASVNVGFEALGDRTAAVPLLIGQYKTKEIQIYTNSAVIGTTWGSVTVGSATHLPLVPSTVWQVGQVNPNDLIELDVSFNVSQASSVAPNCAIAYQTALPGSSFGSWLPVPGSMQAGVQSASNLIWGFNLKGSMVGGAAPALVYNFAVMIYNPSGGSQDSWYGTGDFTVIQKIWRNTGILQ